MCPNNSLVRLRTHFHYCSMFIKLTFDPDSLRQEVSSLRDELTTMMERVDASSIRGFLIAYGFQCDFFGVEYSKEVSWVRMDNIMLVTNSISCAVVPEQCVSGPRREGNQTLRF